ncbi:MAG: Fic family protein [Chloroflexi bacterium]|nr:Fic family protein [Chloroflexota bacterium]
MKIGPSDPEWRRDIEIRNLGEVDEYHKWLDVNHPGFSITEGLVLELHRLTIQGLYSCAGNYRTAVFDVTVGSDSFEPVPASEVQFRVRDIIERYRRAPQATVAQKANAAAQFFHEFLLIHPFCGGNGRVARALLNMILHRQGLLIGEQSIHYYIKQDNEKYLHALHEADRGRLSLLRELIVTSSIYAHIDQVYALLAQLGKLNERPNRNHRIWDPVERLDLSPDEFNTVLESLLPQICHLLGELTSG